MVPIWKLFVCVKDYFIKVDLRMLGNPSKEKLNKTSFDHNIRYLYLAVSQNNKLTTNFITEGYGFCKVLGVILFFFLSHRKPGFIIQEEYATQMALDNPCSIYTCTKGRFSCRKTFHWKMFYICLMRTIN